MMILDPPCSLAPNNKDEAQAMPSLSEGSQGVAGVVVDCFLSAETLITVKIRQKAPAVIVNSKMGICSPHTGQPVTLRCSAVTT